MRNRPIMALLCSVLLAAGSPLLADSYQQHDDLEIHYNAMPTTRLAPAIAEERGIQRSRLQGMVVISVQRDGKSVPARLRGHAIDGAGETRDIDFRKIRQGNFVNTVGTFRIDDLERLRFELEVQPRDDDARYPIRFSERFHVD
ncbi:DUF4426 domain-containing protein [Methylonatrum kenyense]|uniref:DUF4426 domain-containing protein n=1 Tax=Methylonatrum kenyense TaxID=455253 RepID=UPI0020BE4692|nr:DUF4426 domain-containing protein [Methylonatrum kenyense]MCK8516653.1 DUF4426 domain-containing protein [Methylonatrum kenyense]